LYKSGIIIKLEKKVAVVFSEFAEYEKIKRIPGMFEGQMIQYSITKSNSIHKKLAAFSGVAAILVFVFAVFFIFSKASKPQVFAFIDLDVNPSIEFSIDEKSKVLGIKSINDDAKDIVQNLDIRGMNINDAVSETIEELKERGFISPIKENVVLISASSNSDSDISLTEFNKSSKKLKITMSSLRNSIMAEKENKYSVKLVSVSYEERQNSLVNNMSMGRYFIYSKAVENGRSITPQDAKFVALGELVSYLPKDFGTKDIDFMVPDRIILDNDEKMKKGSDQLEEEPLEEKNSNKASDGKNNTDDFRNKVIRDADNTTGEKFNKKNNNVISLRDKETRKHNDSGGYENCDSIYTPLPSEYDEQIDLADVTPITVTPIPYNTPMPISTSENVEYDKEQASKTIVSYAPPVSTPDSSVIKNSNNDQYVSSNSGSSTVNTPVNTTVNNKVNTPAIVPTSVPTSVPTPSSNGHRHGNGTDSDQSRDRGSIQDIPKQGIQKPDIPIQDIPKQGIQKPDMPIQDVPKQGFQKPVIPIPGVSQPTRCPDGFKQHNDQKHRRI